MEASVSCWIFSISFETLSPSAIAVCSFFMAGMTSLSISLKNAVARLPRSNHRPRSCSTTLVNF